MIKLIKKKVTYQKRNLIFQIKSPNQIQNYLFKIFGYYFLNLKFF